MIISTNFWYKLYGIKENSFITIPHLMSLLFYTNYTKKSYNFSASFRRSSWNEPDALWKARHCCFANWARLLRETIECYGSHMKYCGADIFYHGLGKEFIFKGTTFKAFGPISTTTGFVLYLYLFLLNFILFFDIIN